MRFVLKPDKILSYNAYLHYNRRGNRYITHEGQVYKQFIQEQVKRTMVENDWNMSVEKLKVDIVYRLKGRRRRDLDDMDKPLFDILNGIVYEDDSQIFQHSCEKTLGCLDEEIVMCVAKYD